MRKLLCVLILGVATFGHATTLYVNKDSGCPGAGTDTNPYCSIQNAFNVAVAGDDIRVRKASSPYDENAVAKSSGVSGSPIVIEADDPANPPVIRYTGNGAVAAAIQIMDKSYWTIRNLVFDGSGVFTSTAALWIGLNNTSRWTSGPDMTGFTVLNNVFKNWGGTETQEAGLNTGTQSAVSAVLISGGWGPPAGAYTLSGTVVQGNVFDTNRMVALTMTSTKNSVVQNNEFKGTTCGYASSGGTGLAVIADGVHNISGTQGVGSGDVYKNNTFHDFQSPSSCGLVVTGDGYNEWDGIHCDLGPSNNAADGNTFYNLDPSNVRNGASTGLHIEAQCFGWTLKNNVIYNIGFDGILNNQQSGTGAVNKYLNNTIYNTGKNGIELRYGYATVENNIIDNGKSMQIYVQPLAVSSGNLLIDYNDYWDLSGGSKVGSWNSSSVQTLTNWRIQCGCDTHSINTDALFVSPPSNFSLQPSSPAISAGYGGVTLGAIVGPAPPIGLVVVVH